MSMETNNNLNPNQCLDRNSFKKSKVDYLDSIIEKESLRAIFYISYKYYFLD